MHFYENQRDAPDTVVRRHGHPMAVVDRVEDEDIGDDECVRKRDEKLINRF